MEGLSDYKNLKVLVTGHTGFKGAWLSVWLHHLGANVIGFSLEKSHNDELYQQIKDKGVFYADEKGDIRNYSHIKNVFKKYSPNIVFHLAAQALVRESYKEPRYTFETNVLGTANLLDCINNSETKSAVIVTTDKCYKNKEQIWPYREKDELGGKDPYSCSKACAELVISSYRDSFFSQKQILVSSVRAGNVVGGGDWSKDRLIPDCIKSLMANKPIKIRNPNSQRPWQHVLEPLYGYLLIGLKLMRGDKLYADSFNFGPKPGDIIQVRGVVDIVIKYWGKGEWISSGSDSEKFHEAKLLNLDITKSNLMLNWTPVYNIEDSIRLATEWYRNNKERTGYELCIAQIRDYSRIREDEI